MRQTVRLIAGAFAVALSACTEPKGLLGTWQGLQPADLELTLSVGGAYSMTSRSGEFWSSTTGSYYLRADSIEMRPSRRVSRLAPYGSMQTEDLSAVVSFHGSLELRGDTLIIRYVSAPYDTPAEFTWRFIRGP